MKLRDLILACVSLEDGGQTHPYSTPFLIELIKKESPGYGRPNIFIGYREYSYYSDDPDLHIQEHCLENFLSRLGEVVSLDSEDWTVYGHTLDKIEKAGKFISKVAREIKKGVKSNG